MRKAASPSLKVRLQWQRLHCCPMVLYKILEETPLFPIYRKGMLLRPTKVSNNQHVYFTNFSQIKKSYSIHMLSIQIDTYCLELNWNNSKWNNIKLSIIANNSFWCCRDIRYSRVYADRKPVIFYRFLSLKIRGRPPPFIFYLQWSDLMKICGHYCFLGKP